MKPKLRRWVEHYGITVIQKRDGGEEKVQSGFFCENKWTGRTHTLVGLELAG